MRWTSGFVIICVIELGCILVAGARKPLECYKCDNEKSNFMCMSDFNIEKCGRGFDTCQTLVSYSEVSEKMSITKICTKNTSCHQQINATRDKMPCDLTLNSWACASCCHTDRCNLSDADGMVPILWTFWTLLSISVVSQFKNIS